MVSLQDLQTFKQKWKKISCELSQKGRVKKYPHMFIQITSLVSLFMVFHPQLIIRGTTDHQH